MPKMVEDVALAIENLFDKFRVQHHKIGPTQLILRILRIQQIFEQQQNRKKHYPKFYPKAFLINLRFAFTTYPPN